MIKADLGINIETKLYDYTHNRDTISYHYLGNANGYILAALKIIKIKRQQIFFENCKTIPIRQNSIL